MYEIFAIEECSHFAWYDLIMLHVPLRPTFYYKKYFPTFGSLDFFKIRGEHQTQIFWDDRTRCRLWQEHFAKTEPDWHQVGRRSKVGIRAALRGGYRNFWRSPSGGGGRGKWRKKTIILDNIRKRGRNRMPMVGVSKDVRNNHKTTIKAVKPFTCNHLWAPFTLSQLSQYRQSPVLQSCLNAQSYSSGRGLHVTGSDESGDAPQQFSQTSQFAFQGCKNLSFFFSVQNGAYQVKSRQSKKFNCKMRITI